MGRLHNVFHPWLLHLYDGEPLPGQEYPADHVPLEADEEDYNIKQILNCRVDRRMINLDRTRGVTKYKIDWLDYNGAPTWEPY